MDLTSISNAQQAQVMTKVQTAVLAQSMDVQRMEGGAAIALIDAAARAGDPQTAAATGLGGQLDVRG